jgi:hypothetical protein
MKVTVVGTRGEQSYECDEVIVKDGFLKLTQKKERMEIYIALPRIDGYMVSEIEETVQKVEKTKKSKVTKPISAAGGYPG